MFDYYSVFTLTIFMQYLLSNYITYKQKEQEEGTTNLVLLHFNQNPDASMDHSISTVKRLLDMKRNELLKHVFTDDDGDFPNEWKHLHLSCFKVFQLLYNSSNLYDTESELQLDIAKAIYVSPKHELPKCTKPHTTFQAVPKKGNVMISAQYYDQYIMNNHRLSKRPMRNTSPKVINSTMFGLSFI